MAGKMRGRGWAHGLWQQQLTGSVTGCELPTQVFCHVATSVWQAAWFENLAQAGCCVVLMGLVYM